QWRSISSSYCSPFADAPQRFHLEIIHRAHHREFAASVEAFRKLLASTHASADVGHRSRSTPWSDPETIYSEMLSNSPSSNVRRRCEKSRPHSSSGRNLGHPPSRLIALAQLTHRPAVFSD